MYKYVAIGKFYGTTVVAVGDTIDEVIEDFNSTDPHCPFQEALEEDKLQVYELGDEVEVSFKVEVVKKVKAVAAKKTPKVINQKV